MLRRSIVHWAEPTTAVVKRPVKKLDFEAFPRPFARKTLFELARGLFTFRLCTTKLAVDSAPRLLRMSNALLGKTLTYNTFVKWTIFDHFCGGTDEGNIGPALKNLADQGIGPILDYAAEADMDDPANRQANAEPAPITDLQECLTMQHTPWPGDHLYDANAKLFHDCMRHAANNKPPSGIAFSAIKVSGLCSPQLLVRISAILLSLRQGWVSLFCKPNEAPPSIEDCRVVIDRHLMPSHRLISRAQFVEGAIRLGKGKLSKEAAERVAAALDEKNTGNIDYLDYTNVVAVAMLSAKPATGAIAELLKCLPSLSQAEKEALQRFEKRLFDIVEMGVKHGVRVMVDAEQSYMQMAIDHYVRELQRKYNKTTPAVYNTYQCYLTYTEKRLTNDLQRAQREGWMWAGKMVRGAYMFTERELAKQHEYPDPIWPNQAATHACYNGCANIILDLIRKKDSKPIGVLYGSHNQQSLQMIANAVYDMQKLDHKGEISFAQLYGMGDHLTLPLAECGYNVFKYVPYGPVHETIPYLHRRAQENHTMMANATSERGLLWQEFVRRLTFRG